MYKTLLTSLENNILTVTINCPDKMNALNKDVIQDLTEVVKEIYSKDEIWGVIITGAGEKAFVAGADISEFREMDAAAGEALARFGQKEVFDKIENAPKPIIAAVNGFALGGGCELALSCHFIYASEKAKFGQPEVNLGLIPGYGGTQRLTRLVGKNMAMELILTGKMITAQEALQIGLANKVCTPETLLEEAKKTMSLIISKGPQSIARVIETVNAFNHTQSGFDFEIQKFGECFGTDEMKEGVNAFLEKRAAKFR